MFWKKKKTNQDPAGKIILSMVLLREPDSFDLVQFQKDFNNSNSDPIQELSGDNTSAAFKISGEMVAIGLMPVPIPGGDIEGTARYAYYWPTALEDTKEHKSHLIVSVMQGGNDQVMRFRILTQVLSSLLRSTDAIGIYMGGQSLLIPKEDYLNEAALMDETLLPLNLWIYFGLLKTDKGNSAYTYGLKHFGKLEMEILNSNKSLEYIRELLFNIAHYVIEYDVNFQDGETVGVSEEQKIQISLSRGELVENDSFKLAY